MSSSYIVEPQEGESKKDDTLILMVNDNGVISADQDTLHSLILNHTNATVSVVRLGQTDNDAEEGNITLTVDPPPFTPSESNVTNTSSDPVALVDPFMEMDPEQLERLETALQSEEAKQILGENVTAMLDMLTVEEQQNSIRYSIELDHCYTSRFSSQQKSADALPDVSAPDMDEAVCIELNKSLPHTPILSSISSSNVNHTSITPIKQKVTPVLPKIVKQPVSIGSRPRRASAASQPITNTPKLTTNTHARTMVNSVQKENKHNAKDDDEAENDQLFSSSESSEPEESDSDSDFGVKPLKRGVRARGGRRGLTTRGGSMVASRRRGSNKHMDSEQVRRLDMEMAAAVSAMKSPEKEEKSEKYSPAKSKKQMKSFGGKKKDEVQPAPLSDPPSVETNILHTTNQVKANLINANMFKGDMILTKPGHDRNNQKVVFVQKQVPLNPNDIKTFGIKKQVMISKNKMGSSSSKVSITKDVKLTSPIILKGTQPIVQSSAPRQNITPMEVQVDIAQTLVQTPKAIPSTVTKIKLTDVKKEKKKVDAISESQIKTSIELSKSVDSKPLIAPKKIVKKEHRKSDSLVVEALGPALFSTPDIIRRVGSTGESKTSESSITTCAATVSNIVSNAPVVNNAANVSTISTPSISTMSTNITNILDESMETSNTQNSTGSNKIRAKADSDASILSETLEDDKMDGKATIVEMLQPTLNSALNSISSKEIPTMGQSNSSKHVISESGIEGDDHLLATLSMEAAKQLPNDAELLAEALLLQETLGVDLDHSGLVDQSSELPESILSSTIMGPSSVTAGPIKSDSTLVTVCTVSTVTPTQPKTTMTLATARLPVPAQVSESVTVPVSVPEPTVKTESLFKKDAKEPVQIIRGGRVITLPPIEAPATRSKRLQAKTETPPAKVEKKQQQQQPVQQPKVEPLIIKTERVSRTTSHVSLQKQDMIYDMEDDDEGEEGEANSGSEDDPNRLWCICRQPHNNRFMICCDICQDWFHGKCVHVTKALGEQMESQGIEWVCPNCSKKKNEESKQKSTPRRPRNSIDAMQTDQNKTPTASNATSEARTPNSGKHSGASSGVTYCVVCKKEARKSSIYCSDACILAHAEVTSTKDKASPMPTAKTQKVDASKLKTEARIVVYDKRTGKVLTGADAPTASNLKVWLKEHPAYELVKSNSLNTVQLGGKTVAAIHTQGVKTQKLVQGKSSGQTKMVYSKVAGSKQTVLSSSKKKAVLLTDTPPSHSVSSPQHRPKQTLNTTSNKTPNNLKQSNIKTMMQQQQTPQKPIATSTPKIQTVKKVQEAKPSTSQQKQQQQQVKAKTPPPKKSETEPIRLSVRKTLAELLTSRIKETVDINLTEEEIVETALQIELEMYKFFKNTDAKYKAKYRSLVFNIKDTKNLTLFRKIADRSLTPGAVVKLSPEEMASQELAEWREKENKHQLEMIKKNELDLMAQAKSIVVKTHKGEQIIENDGAIEKIDPKTPVQDIVTALNSGETITSTVEEQCKQKEKLLDEFKKSRVFEEEKKKKKEKDRDREKRRNRSQERSIKDITRHDRSRSKSRRRHSKERDKSKERKSKKDGKHKDKDRVRDKDKEHKSRDRDKKKDKDRKEKHKRSRSHSKNRHKDHKDKYKKEEEKKKDLSKSEIVSVSMDKSIEDRLWRHIEDETTTNTFEGNESDVSDREPSSTVTIKTPDINEELDKELIETQPNEEPKTAMTVWRGCVYMADVAKFFVTAQNVSGNSKDLMEDLPETLDVVGRINPATVWDYIGKMKKNATKEILIIKLTATNDEEKIPYITLYSYLNSRNRLGVLGSISPNIKDFYVMPFSNGSKLPSVLLPLESPGLEENRQHLLLGIIVVHSRKKRVANIPLQLTPIPLKIFKKEVPSDRSFTPPPPLTSITKDESITPPNSPKQNTQNRIGTQESKQGLSTISKIVPELSSKIMMESSSSSDKMQLDDDDEPYSPGEPVDVNLDDDEDALSSSSMKVAQSSVSDKQSSATVDVSPIKSSTELQRKMEELSRQIEEEKQQIQNISSSFLGDTSATLPGLGLDPSNSSDAVDAYSPSDTRSFTPPPQGISKLSQPILDKVSNITIPANLQEILANVKRQENSKVDPYLPSKPSATFLTTVNSTIYQNSEKYSSSFSKISSTNKSNSEIQPSLRKESKSTLSSLSDYDIMKKAEEELAALAAAAAASPVSGPSTPTVVPSVTSPKCSEPPPPGTTFDTPHR